MNAINLACRVLQRSEYSNSMTSPVIAAVFSGVLTGCTDCTVRRSNRLVWEEVSGRLAAGVTPAHFCHWTRGLACFQCLFAGRRTIDIALHDSLQDARH